MHHPEMIVRCLSSSVVSMGNNWEYGILGFFRHKIMCFKEIFLSLVYMYVAPNNLLCECWSTKIPWKKQVTLGQNWVHLTFFCHLPSLFLITYVALPPIGGISHKKSYGQRTIALFLLFDITFFMALFRANPSSHIIKQP